MKWLISLAVNSVSLIMADWLLSGIYFSGVMSAFVAAIVLGFINTLIRPLLVLITLPLTAVTLGLFIFVINAVTFAMTAFLVQGFHVNSFGGAFWGAIITSLISWGINKLIND